MTYVIAAPAGSGTMLLNGPAARLGVRGDKVVVLAYGAASAEEAASLRPIIVHVNENNRPIAKSPRRLRVPAADESEVLDGWQSRP